LRKSRISKARDRFGGEIVVLGVDGDTV